MPLHGALQFGNFHATKVCLDNGSKIDETDNKYNNSAVHMACVLGSIELLYLFKKNQPTLFKELVRLFFISQEIKVFFYQIDEIYKIQKKSESIILKNWYQNTSIEIIKF